MTLEDRKRCCVEVVLYRTFPRRVCYYHWNVIPVNENLFVKLLPFFNRSKSAEFEPSVREGRSEERNTVVFSFVHKMERKGLD